MSPNVRRAVVALAVLAMGQLAAPTSVAAHAIGGTFQLPVPLWLYLAGAAAAVAASFVLTARTARRASDPAYETRPIPEELAGTVRPVLRVVGLAWWYGAIGVGFLVGDISPLPAVLLWVFTWVALPIVAAVLGNPWPSLSPFRTTFAGLDWLARRLGAGQLELGLPYPAWMARWPAVALLAAGIWAELILPGTETAGMVAVLLTAYTVLTLAGMILFGPSAWLRHAELFEVLLGWFGRIGSIARQSVSPELCEGCGEACHPDRCIDCPECATAADDGERRAILRPPFVGLTDVTRAGRSDAAFIVLALAGVTYDGLRETAFGGTILETLLPPITDVFGITATAFLLVDTTAFALVVATFLAAFGVIVWLTRRLGGGRRAAVAAYASTLLPIAAGYLVAHYLTLVIRSIVWLPSLIADPLLSLAPDLEWIPVSAVWYLSVAAIVGGHVAGVVLAHRLALRHAPRRAVPAGLPMVALMIGYTILSLWIIAQPIVIEPGVVPAALAEGT
jgi:hypothetical protein